MRKAFDYYTPVPGETHANERRVTPFYEGDTYVAYLRQLPKPLRTALGDPTTGVVRRRAIQVFVDLLDEYQRVADPAAVAHRIPDPVECESVDPFWRAKQILRASLAAQTVVVTYSRAEEDEEFRARDYHAQTMVRVRIRTLVYRLLAARPVTVDVLNLLLAELVQFMADAEFEYGTACALRRSMENEVCTWEETAEALVSTVPSAERAQAAKGWSEGRPKRAPSITSVDWADARFDDVPIQRLHRQEPAWTGGVRRFLAKLGGR